MKKKKITIKINESKGKLPSTLSKIGKPVRIPAPKLPTIKPSLLNLGTTGVTGQTSHVPDDVHTPLEGEFASSGEICAFCTF